MEKNSNKSVVQGEHSLVQLLLLQQDLQLFRAT
jgi:hypothetical protein